MRPGPFFYSIIQKNEYNQIIENEFLHMKKLLFCIIAALAVKAFAQNSDADAIAFATKSGRTTGQATACQMPADEIKNFENTFIKRMRLYKSPSSNVLVQAYNTAMRLAEREPVGTGENGCFFVRMALINGADPSDKPVAADIPAPTKAQVNPEQQAAIERKNLSYVSSQGAHVCRFEQGETRRTLGQALGQTVYDKPVQREFRIEGFTEQASSTRIKVMVNSIRAANRDGFEYLSELQPSYTKGQYVWQESSAWVPCE